MSNERYVVVTAVSQFRQRYAIPVSALQGMSPDVKLDDKTLIEYANDSVVMEEVNEFSQHYMGESIVDTFILDEPRILQLFDRDNDYLKEWTKEKKLEHIHDWEHKKESAGISSPFPIEFDK